MADKIRCAHILVKSEAQAKEILDKLNKGEKFSALAQQYSIDTGSAKRGGDLGQFGRGIMVREFEKAAFSLDKGQVSGVVKTDFGYHIIKRLE